MTTNESCIQILCYEGEFELPESLQHKSWAPDHTVITHARTLEQAAHLLREETFHLVLLHLNPDDESGLNLIEAAAQIPFILYVRNGAAEAAAKVLLRGADVQILPESPDQGALLAPLVENLLMRVKNSPPSNQETEKPEADHKDLLRRNQHLSEKIRQIQNDFEEFAYIVSHDLNAPLRGIRSLTSWIVEDYEDTLDEQGKEFLSDLSDRTRLMQELLDGVLKYSRLGRTRITLENFDTNRAIDTIAGRLDKPEAVSLQIKKETLPTINFDRTMFENIIHYLLDNAFKHLGKPKGTVKIYSEESPTFWIFHVEDDGIGISRRDRDRIFKIFHTLSPRKEGDHVTGTGLAFARRILARFGGKIQLESEENQGSTFSFSIPKNIEVESDRELPTWDPAD